MKQRSIYLVVRVDLDCPDEYCAEDIELASDICVDEVSLDSNNGCEIVNFEICGLNDCL